MVVRAFFWVASICFVACALLNVASSIGYDLGQMISSPWSHAEGRNDGYAFILPIFVGVVALYIPLAFRQFVQGVRFANWSPWPRWARIAILVGFCYVLATMVYMAVVFHGGGPMLHNGVGTIWLKGQDTYLVVTPAEYHRAVAVVVLFISGWGMLAFAAYTMQYRSWIRDIESAHHA